MSFYRFALFVISVAIVHTAMPKGGNDSTGYRVLFLGDTSFGETYQIARQRRGRENVLETRGYNAFLEPWKPFLSDADLVIANLETPLTRMTDSPLDGIKRYIHYGDPDRNTQAFRDAGIDAVALGNNHAMDLVEPGLVETLAALVRADIAWFGAGRNLEEAGRPLRKSIGVSGATLELAVFSSFEYRKGHEEKFKYYAHPDRAGVGPLSVVDFSNRLAEIEQDSKVYSVVFPHWGFNYEAQNELQVSLAHELIDAGADLIVGHGAHALQGIEKYRGKWIFYSIGNFVFLADGRYEEKNTPPFGGLLELAFVPEGQRIRLYPIFTDNLKCDFRARPVTDEEFARVFEELRSISPDPSLIEGEMEKGEDAKGHFIEAGMEAWE
jgi:poly-gamma-glutamate capsule biosynthesis protein CapA/YwtB (metallophosphatase superfamily)